jgi:hypothetical protein
MSEQTVIIVGNIYLTLWCLLTNESGNFNVDCIPFFWSEDHLLRQTSFLTLIG